MYLVDTSIIRTEFPGFVFLCLFIDLAVRKVVGWALADNMETPLAIRAPSRVTERQRPGPGLIVHSELRRSKSRPYARIIKRHTRGLNRDGDVCISWNRSILVYHVDARFDKEHFPNAKAEALENMVGAGPGLDGDSSGASA